MTEPYRLTVLAARDYENILSYTLERYGTAQFDAYRKLLDLAVMTVAKNPAHLGSKERRELGRGVRTYHAALAGQRTGTARHFIVFRLAKDGVVDILRILHDSMDLSRHLPSAEV